MTLGPLSQLEGVAFRDENDVAYGIKHVGNKPRVSSMDYLYDIAEGNIPNHMALNNSATTTM